MIGRSRFSFDVWGDTVNLASRMQTAGIQGRIQVSEATYYRLQHAFELETCAPVALKGEQTAPAYLLVRCRSDAPARRPPAAVAALVGIAK